MKYKTGLLTRYFLGIFTVLILIGMQGLVIAADLASTPPWTDSRIELIDQPGEGPDRVISISMSTKLGESILIINKDGQKTDPKKL